jgi:hypothetical protein
MCADLVIIHTNVMLGLHTNRVTCHIQTDKISFLISSDSVLKTGMKINKQKLDFILSAKTLSNR